MSRKSYNKMTQTYFILYLAQDETDNHSGCQHQMINVLICITSHAGMGLVYCASYRQEYIMN